MRKGSKRAINTPLKIRQRQRKAVLVTLVLLVAVLIGKAVFTDDANIEGQEVEALGYFTVNAYCSCDLCEGGNTSLTSNYEERQPDYTVAVDPKIIPLGSKIIINGKMYSADDSMDGIKGETIAIYKTWHDEVEGFETYETEVFLVVK
jgi:3D (Asp-Asp-Asp) domain-containing protein